jgi:DNA-binding transcriptional regulator GbsR (MarR family)
LTTPEIKNKDDVRIVLRKMRTGVRKAHFEARTGKTDRAVLLFLIKRGIEIGAYNVYPGTRNISVELGITKETVSVSLRRLQDAGWIERQSEGRRKLKGADIWRIRFESFQFESIDELDHSHPLLAYSDIWTPAGLGINAQRVLQYLSATTTSMNVKQIMDITSLGRKAADNAVAKLSGWGIIAKEGKKYLVEPITPEELDHLVLTIDKKYQLNLKKRTKASLYKKERANNRDVFRDNWLEQKGLKF